MQPHSRAAHPTAVLPHTFLLSQHTSACAATLLGCAPNNFVAANAGAHLGELNSMADLVSPKLVALMGVLGVVGESMISRGRGFKGLVRDVVACLQVI